MQWTHFGKQPNRTANEGKWTQIKPSPSLAEEGKIFDPSVLLSRLH
jgi:hypothetical protein